MVIARAQQPPLTFAEYATRSTQTDLFAGVPGGLSKLTFGFFGEVGSLLSALKKISRDRLLESETGVAGEEIGDALWYLMAIAHAHAINPQELGLKCMSYLRKRFKENDCGHGTDVNFRQIDGLIAIHGSELEAQRIELLWHLACASGEVGRHGNTSQLILNHFTLAELLAQLLGMLSLVASSFMLKIEDIARGNLAKIYDRWPEQEAVYCPPFDNTLPEHEQLPRIIPVEFIERQTSRGAYVVQRSHSVFIGDRLTDNHHEPDDYRFHDVFHLAYVAHLGWSPVIRALLKVKRKSIPRIDENEDGARAMIIEEGIATWIFNHAKPRKYYEGVELGKLEYSLLKQVHSMVTGYEVAALPLWQWERAILDGFKVFRQLRRPEHRGGKVTVNLIEHTLVFEPPTSITK